MGVLRIELSDELTNLIDRQVAQGRAPNLEAFLADAVIRHAEDLDAEDALVAVAETGIADIEAGRYTLIETPEDAEALHQRAMALVRARLADDNA